MSFRIATPLLAILLLPGWAFAQPSAYLGLSGDSAEGPLAGVVVRQVLPGSPAEFSGFLPGDVIVGLEGREIDSLDDMSAIFGEYAAGETVEFEIVRGTGRLRLPVQLGMMAAELDEPEELPAPSGGSPAHPVWQPEPTTGDQALLGVHVVPLTEARQVELGVPVSSGVVIDSIQQGSPADLYRLPIGGVIVAVDDARILQPTDLVAVIGARQPGEEVAIRYWNGLEVYEREVVLAPGGTAPVIAPLASPAVQEDPPLVLRPAAEGEALPFPELPDRLEPSNAGEGSELERMLMELRDLRARSESLQERINALEQAIENYQAERVDRLP